MATHSTSQYKPSHQGRMVYEKVYMVPSMRKSYTTDNLTVTTAPSGAQQTMVKSYSRHDTKGDKSDIYTTLQTKSPQLAQRKYVRYRMFMDKLQRPPVKKPFLVSSPHWLSASHLQQWPWKSQLTCTLQSPGHNVQVDRRCCHTGCWKNIYASHR